MNVPSSVSAPLVSVITPCYNGEPYLQECIESVLKQTHRSFEYIIVDNQSDDGSLETAERFARLDARIKIVKNQKFLPQLANFNWAFRQMSSKSKYCKIVNADDRIYPDCLEKMVNLAERNPSVVIVSAYTLIDHKDHTRVYLTGLPHSCTVTSGRDACRRFLLSGTNLFGNPTSTLIRSEVIRSEEQFYDEESVIADIDVCFRILTNADFGFVHEVLTYTRRYNDSIMSVVGKLQIWPLTCLISLYKYGGIYLEEEEFKNARRKINSAYHKALGESILLGQPREVREFHRHATRPVGYQLNRATLLWCLVVEVVDLVLNPKRTLEQLLRHRRKKVDKIDPQRVTDLYRRGSM